MRWQRCCYAAALLLCVRPIRRVDAKLAFWKELRVELARPRDGSLVLERRRVDVEETAARRQAA